VGTGYNRCAGWRRLDLADAGGVAALIRDVRPDAILNPGGITAVDWCEDHPEEALAINGVAPGIMAEEARKRGAYFAHFSTDFVFDGADGPYSEDEETRPLSAYARSKWEGEVRVAAEGRACAILRTAVVYSFEEGEKNFLMQIVDAAREGRTSAAYADQVNSPTQADNLAEAAVEFAERRIEGLFHVAGASVISRYDFAREILRQFRLGGGAIVPVTVRERPQKAPRPANAGLRIGKASGVLRTRLWDVPQGLQRCLGDYLK